MAVHKLHGILDNVAHSLHDVLLILQDSFFPHKVFLS